ncbi:MAG: YraN family protein [Bacteroidales bacterium]|nr:YraN family protein [Bacteroidales bacterium]
MQIRKGKVYEEIAVDYLKQKGYIIREVNWRWRNKEIDIIAETKDWLIIVEVKGRTNLTYGKPHEFINEAKKKFLTEAAEAYINLNQISFNIRFDAISVYECNNQFVVEHFENIFML